MHMWGPQLPEAIIMGSQVEMMRQHIMMVEPQVLGQTFR